ERTQPAAREAAPLPDTSLLNRALRLDDAPGYGLSDPDVKRTLHLEPVAKESATLHTRLAVLGGTWDYRTMEFRQHPHLQPDPRALGLAAGTPLNFLSQAEELNDLMPNTLDDLLNRLFQLVLQSNEQLQQLNQLAEIFKDPVKALK